ncbi:MAG: mechanosensitive ion channel family protein [Zunongwangia sp.]|uniref:Small-conductance mechanosensitive ion channel protein n=2 Tax=Zunongwangia profunda TaxID=398743 RepID=D5BFM3_ZUNPS|nr:mechanosensitive ion channel family protein [Zunongwangia profunda]MAG87040.1 mechanosensitive ion channel family protein [Flavobacteriaceae bacterium]MAO34413.1 mechanosensitive ion channel family protein [Zunongwangia sp.]ADF50967.1 small-conductance mechanosensitive ion channel protein [Zunongwangia profunda SM-A87]MAS72527.1 mechanosensitive ion channel family protein [Zunongwangia sp.]MCC4227259.1 mechanosensitive ion channel family protein [Zunongwangia profunda]|tara:strand:+ start:18070 stop:18960 length:891 start_codon:yes stop_codon:yes gene_type:complete
MDKFNDFSELAQEYAKKLIDFLPDLIAAILILIIGFWIAKRAVKFMQKALDKRDYDVALKGFLTTLVSWALKILVIIVAISQVGIETTSLVAILGAAGLAIGLALQGSLANFAGGVLIIVLKPFKVGDWIEAQGVSGSVKSVSLFYTKLDTFGNQEAVIPNGSLANDNIINYTVNGVRRENMTFGISYDDDIKKAKEVLMNLIKEQEGIEAEPAPQVLVGELGDNSVNFYVRYFAKNPVFWDIHWFMLEEGKIRLEEAGMTIPYPQRDVYLYDQTKMSGTVLKESKKEKDSTDKTE